MVIKFGCAHWLAHRMVARWCAANVAATPLMQKSWALSWPKSCWPTAHVKFCMRLPGKPSAMTILVTRPSPSGEQLVSRLRTLGRVAYHSPLIEFAPGRELATLPNLLSSLNPHDLVFVLSQHVVKYAEHALNQAKQHWPEAVNYYAIGRTTGLLFHRVSSLPVIYPHDGETSEVLLNLPDLQHLAGKKALILRGNGGRELLAETLRQRGVEVIYCECYQRSQIYYDGS